MNCRRSLAAAVSDRPSPSICLQDSTDQGDSIRQAIQDCWRGRKPPGPLLSLVRPGNKISTNASHCTGRIYDHSSPEHQSCPNNSTNLFHDICNKCSGGGISIWIFFTNITAVQSPARYTIKYLICGYLFLFCMKESTLIEGKKQPSRPVTLLVMLDSI